MMRHVLQGIVVYDETLAMDLIKKIGSAENHPNKGSYSKMHEGLSTFI